MLDEVFIKCDELMTRHIAGETLVVPIKGHVGDLDSIYTLNEVGSKIWQLLDGRNSAREIVDVITTEYDVLPEEARCDVVELLKLLKAAGLIRSDTEDGDKA